MALKTNWQGYRTLAWLGLVILIITTIYLVWQNNLPGALTLGGFTLVAFLFLILDKRLPNLFDFLFVLAALLNAGGWAFDFFSRIWPYDEFVHLYTTFAITFALGYLARGNLQVRQHPTLFFSLIIASFGIAIGAIWEIIEWSADHFVGARVVKGLDDTVIDLIMDTIGALVAGGLSVLGPKKEPIA